MALFKIFKRGQDSARDLTASTGENVVPAKNGYAYFDQLTGKFYIDIADSNTPIVGNSSAETVDGLPVNRICINNNGPMFAEDVVLDCGDSEEELNIQYIFDCGGANGHNIPDDEAILNAALDDVIADQEALIGDGAGNTPELYSMLDEVIAEQESYINQE